MELDITSLPDVLELTPVSSTVTLVPGETEEDAVITSFTVSKSDQGVSLSFTDTTATISGTGYRETFASEIGYAEPQVDELTKPVYHEVTSWGNVPDPEQTDLIWFLYKYKAPSITVETYTYTVSGTYTSNPTPEIPDTGVEDIPFILTFTQTVLYDIDTNVAEFKRYI